MPEDQAFDLESGSGNGPTGSTTRAGPIDDQGMKMRISGRLEPTSKSRKPHKRGKRGGQHSHPKSAEAEEQEPVGRKLLRSPDDERAYDDCARSHHHVDCRDLYLRRDDDFPDNYRRRDEYYSYDLYPRGCLPRWYFDSQYKDRQDHSREYQDQLESHHAFTLTSLSTSPDRGRTGPRDDGRASRDAFVYSGQDDNRGSVTSQTSEDKFSVLDNTLKAPVAVKPAIVKNAGAPETIATTATSASTIVVTRVIKIKVILSMTGLTRS